MLPFDSLRFAHASLTDSTNRFSSNDQWTAEEDGDDALLFESMKNDYVSDGDIYSLLIPWDLRISLTDSTDRFSSNGQWSAWEDGDDVLLF